MQSNDTLKHLSLYARFVCLFMSRRKITFEQSAMGIIDFSNANAVMHAMPQDRL